MKTTRGKQRLVIIALILALFTSVTLGSASGLAVTQREILVNGGFEGGFTYVAGCGAVGVGWGCFTNGGSVIYGFYDDQWKPVVAEGKHSQLIELNTMQFAASEADRFAGIYQTVRVAKGSKYQFKIKGMLREALRDGMQPDPNDDKFRYRVQWGYTADGSTDWTKVTNWVELPWDNIYGRTAPGSFESYATSFVAPSDKITLFVRVWKKWGTVYRELDVNLDAISLFGPAVTKPPVVVVPPSKPPVVVVPPQPQEPPKPPVVVVPPVAAVPPQPGVCGGTNYIANGSFEHGFVHGVGAGWVAFTNGGQATYGFYDEMWKPVIKDGAHGQLIEINTLNRPASDPDRVAGIYQVVKGLRPGVTYEFALYGMMREEKAHPDEDAYRYRIQWGYASYATGANESAIINWTDLPIDKIYVRTAPGEMTYASVKFQAPSSAILIGVRALKKWATPYRELDVNLDAIKLMECAPGKDVVVIPPQPPEPPACTWVVVKRGDTVSALAKKYNSTIALITKANKLKNPNLIYVGQKLCIPPDP